MTLTRRGLLGAGAAAGLALLGCGASDPRLGSASKALARRSVAIDYASYYAPIADVRRLAAAHAAAVGAAVTFSDDADGVAAQTANLRRWTGAQGGFRAIAVAPFDPAAVEPIARAALARDVAIVAFLSRLEHQSAAISVDHARAGTLLAEHAAGWGGRQGGVLLVRPLPAVAIPDPFAPGFATAEAAIRRTLAARDIAVAGTVQAQARSDAAQAVTAALRTQPGTRTVLAWNDATALGAADALGGGARGYAGGLGMPAVTTPDTLAALRGGSALRCIVSPRLADLAQALVDVPLALARGTATSGRVVPVHRLTSADRALLRAFASDYGPAQTPEEAP